MLIDRTGHRKYLVSEEWYAFLAAARCSKAEIRTFCFVLALTGARLSEVLMLTPQSVDIANQAIIIECLKRRRRGIYRSVPVPAELIGLLESTHEVALKRHDPIARMERIWGWSRTTAWTKIKETCKRAGIPDSVSMPKAFRHSFGVEGAINANVPIGTIKRWLGHARLESTILYCEAVGDEERLLAARMWNRCDRLA
ncbi:MAG: site-specific integrase [Proteobacteria bacterium]|nr:site-specific integrase [Pseudomonadota bacterium]